MDALSLGHSAYTFKKQPNLINAGFLIWDAAALTIPGVPGSYIAKGTKKLAGKAGAKKAVRLVKRTGKAVNLASPAKTKHILYGDKTGGGHLWPGKHGKSVFPKRWSAEKAMHYISDIATDPKIKWVKNRVVNGKQRYEAVGIRDGVKVKVIIEPNGVGIVTAFPI